MEESRSWREDLRDCTEAEREDAELVVDIVAVRSLCHRQYLANGIWISRRGRGLRVLRLYGLDM